MRQARTSPECRGRTHHRLPGVRKVEKLAVHVPMHLLKHVLAGPPLKRPSTAATAATAATASMRLQVSQRMDTLPQAMRGAPTGPWSPMVPLVPQVQPQNLGSGSTGRPSGSQWPQNQQPAVLGSATAAVPRCEAPHPSVMTPPPRRDAEETSWKA